MIIFDLACLANDEHRRHFIDSSSLGTEEQYKNWLRPFLEKKECPHWKPDFQAYNEAFVEDEPIRIVLDMFFRLLEEKDEEINVWTNSPECMEEKTEIWIKNHLDYQFGSNPYFCWTYSLQMRPIGDMRPQEELFEGWLGKQLSPKGESFLTSKD